MYLIIQHKLTNLLIFKINTHVLNYIYIIFYLAVVFNIYLRRCHSCLLVFLFSHFSFFRRFHRPRYLFFTRCCFLEVAELVLYGFLVVSRFWSIYAGRLKIKRAARKPKWCDNLLGKKFAWKTKPAECSKHDERVQQIVSIVLLINCCQLINHL